MVKRILKSRVTSWISLAIGLLITAAIIVLLVLRTDFFANRTSRMFSQYFFGGTDFSLTIGKLSGNPAKNMEIEDLRIRYNGEDYSFDVVRIEKVKCVYDIGSLVSGDPVINELELVNPHVWIKPDSNGVNIIPKTGGSESGSMTRFRIERLSVREGQLIYQGPGRADAWRNLNLEAMISSDGREIAAVIGSGSFEDIRRKLYFRSVKGSMFWSGQQGAGDDEGGYFKGARLKDLYMELDESLMIVNGTFDPDSVSMDLSVSIEPLDVEEITRALGIETTHYGELQGNVRMGGEPDVLQMEGVLNGILSGYALEDFDFQITKNAESVRLVRGKGRVNGADIDGTGTILLGDPGRMEFEIVAGEMDISDGFFPGKTIPETLLNGKIGVRYVPAGGRIDFDLDLQDGHINRFPFEEARMTGWFRTDTIRFDRLDLISPTHSLEMDGEIVGGDRIRFIIDLDCDRSDTLFSYIGIPDYRADLKMNGIWEGTLERWNMRSNGEFSDLRYMNTVIHSGWLNVAVLNDGTINFLGDIAGDSCTVDRLGFSSIDLSIEARDSTTTIKRLYLDSPDLSAEIRGEISVDGDLTTIGLSNVDISALGERWLSNGEFLIRMEGPRIEFTDMQLHSRLGALYADLLLNRSEESVNGLLRFDRLGLALLNRAGLTGSPMEGRVEGSVGFSGPWKDPGLDIDILAEDCLIDSMRVDSIKVMTGYSDGVINVNTLALDSPEGNVVITGSLSGTGPGKIISDGLESLRGVTVDLRGACRRFSLKPLAVGMENAPFEGGFYTGSVVMSDSLVHPEVHIHGGVEDLSMGRITIPTIRLIAGVSGGDIDLEGSMIISSNKIGSFSGRVPVRPARWFYGIDDSRDMHLEFEMPGGDIADIPRLTDLVAEASGDYSLQAVIDGTPSDPSIRGALVMGGAGFRFAGWEERFRDVEARIELQDSVVTISTLKGKEGSKGSFEVDGTIVLDGWKPGRYDLRCTVDKVLVASIPNVMAMATGSIDVGTWTEGELSIPMINGTLDVNRAEVYLDLGDLSSEGSTETMDLPSWLARIDLKIQGNTWVKTPDANVEMRGDITIHHDRRGFYLRGTLELVRGWYNVYNNKFRVTSGTLDFVSAEGFRPVVDIQAQTLDPEGKKIYLTLSWHQDDIEPRLSLYHEDPGYSETDIWKMLGGGVVGSSGSDASWDALSTAQNLAANYIERMLNSQMQGVTIELETMGGTGSSATGGESKETMVAIGKYLSEGLYVKYKQGLSISTARHFEVEYRISNYVLIRSEIIKYSEKVLHGGGERSSDEINVDLKLRWEF